MKIMITIALATGAKGGEADEGMGSKGRLLRRVKHNAYVTYVSIHTYIYYKQIYTNNNIYIYIYIYMCIYTTHISLSLYIYIYICIHIYICVHT